MRAYLSRTSAPTPVLIRAANGFQIILGKVRPITSPGREPSTSSDHCSSRPLDPPTSAPCPGTSTDIQLSLKIGTLYSGAFRWTNANGGQNGGQTTAKVSEVACLAMSGTAVEDLPAWASVQQVSYITGGRRCRRHGSRQQARGECGLPIVMTVDPSDRAMGWLCTPGGPWS